MQHAEGRQWIGGELLSCMRTELKKKHALIAIRRTFIKKGKVFSGKNNPIWP